MEKIINLEPVDYLVIGHITCDLLTNGCRPGGTVVYSGLTARALGARVGIVTSSQANLPLDVLQGIPVFRYDADATTTFENIYTPEGRIQVIHSVANRLEYQHIPEIWRKAPIIHLGPVCQEVDPTMVRYFPTSLVGLTPQGWLRAWNGEGHVYPTEWPEASFILRQVGASVISIEDVGGDERIIEEMATASRVLAVTEAENGARLYWNGDVRRFRPVAVREVDPTGSGDIFAAAFFNRLHVTRDPWEAARFATQLSAYSVTREGLEGIPLQEEIQESMVEVF